MLEETSTYDEIYNATTNKWGIAEVKGTEGVYYMDGKQLILAQPELNDFFGSVCCRARYYICNKGAKEGSISYTPITLSNLTIIVDTVSLFMHNTEDYEASHKAILRGDSFLVDKGDADEDTAVQYKCNHKVHSILYTNLQGGESKVFFNYYDVATTDFLISTVKVESDEIKENYSVGTYCTLSSLSRLYLWRMLRLLVSKDASANFYYAMTPFSKICEVLIVDDMYSESSILTALKQDHSVKKYRVIYDRAQGRMYTISVIGTIVGVQKYICFPSISRSFIVSEGADSYVESCKFIPTTVTYWGEGAERFSPVVLSYALIRYLIDIYKVNTESFD